jgi:hypothetical protein
MVGLAVVDRNYRNFELSAEQPLSTTAMSSSIKVVKVIFFLIVNTVKPPF